MSVRWYIQYDLIDLQWLNAGLLTCQDRCNYSATLRGPFLHRC